MTDYKLPQGNRIIWMSHYHSTTECHNSWVEYSPSTSAGVDICLKEAKFTRSRESQRALDQMKVILTFTQTETALRDFGKPFRTITGV